MGKYDPLEGHLRRQKAATYDMSFRDIERLLGALLPARARRPDWWAYDDAQGSGPVQCLAWRRAGYRAHLLKDDERVRFERIAR
ncbi:MAG: hypothetical protein KKE02_06525 [Alphaproteobacteria bacterium]|nr:hypothetical protein [Alphaproteobacteria bacterium]MBU1513077.1 hypothetical protein [Alphaproteobacteria bacterium]MBU2095185.1 hypothetical protein [Alphaproteobacteria bacterium]MBU2150656.1 hypothetical protein [Alphaproteobacteria bacterium]MBU2306085.1 hypothetical protein [Alphaproteobacteria bacterium]